ncbi:tetratricopeptide repeat protein [Alkalicoccus daliensis]|uniref:Tetratricopeptide repeat-containing protein n=1 Tax=Alkalicoccus daliensis TaxID=745820 RepID=A0A1H0J9F9_9BACI|nr:tetratricopeptide repeat protein [Alkalicoccus daliensis]SDO40367.1 Tetratricopeptide repeat-containing protein [Alkalicoccus daliensis]
MNQIEQRAGQIIPFMQDGSYFYKKGIEAYEKKEITRAVQLIKRAIQAEPTEPVFLCQLAIVLSEEGEYEASNEWLNKIKEEVDPQMSECYFFLANNQVYTGEFHKAKENLEKYFELDQTGDFQEDADALLYLIDVELGMDQLQIDGTNPFTSPLTMRLHEGEYAQAEELARGIIVNKPASWHTYALLAEALWRQGSAEEAGQILTDLLMKEEPDFTARCQYTIFLYETNDEEAENWIRKLKTLYPLNRWERYVAGRALYFVEEFEAAYSLLREAMPLEQPVYVHQLAVAAAQCGRFHRARKLWNQAAVMESDKQPKFLNLKLKMDAAELAEKHDHEWLY